MSEAPPLPEPSGSEHPTEPTTHRLASLGRRAGATAIDSLMALILLGYLFELVVPGTLDSNSDLTPEQESAAAIAFFGGLAVWLVYVSVCEWRWGQTLGKRVCGVKVISATGKQLSFLGAVLRAILLIPDAIAAWFLIPLSASRQRLGDRAAETLVVRGSPGPKPETPVATSLPPPVPAPIEGPGASTVTVPLPGKGPAPAEISASSPATNAAWGPLRALAGLAVLLLLILLMTIPFAFADPELESIGTNLGVQGLLALAMIVAAFITPLSFSRGRSLTWAPRVILGLGRSMISPWAWAALAYVAYFLIAIAMAALLSPEQEDIAADLGYGQGWLADVLTGFLIVIAAPVAEEIFFRGFMFAGIRSKAPFIVAAVVSAAVWGLFHFTGSDSWPVVLQLSLFGVILAWLYEKTGSIRGPIALHMINNAIAFTFLITN